MTAEHFKMCTLCTKEISVYLKLTNLNDFSFLTCYDYEKVSAFIADFPNCKRIYTSGDACVLFMFIHLVFR